MYSSLCKYNQINTDNLLYYWLNVQNRNFRKTLWLSIIKYNSINVNFHPGFVRLECLNRHEFKKFISNMTLYSSNNNNYNVEIKVYVKHFRAQDAVYSNDLSSETFWEGQPDNRFTDMRLNSYKFTTILHRIVNLWKIPRTICGQVRDGDRENSNNCFVCAPKTYSGQALQ